MSGSEKHRRDAFKSEQVYRKLLAAYPKELRDACGDEMVRLFRDQCREEAARAGAWGLPRLWVGVLFDLISTVYRERRGPLMSLFGFVRWGGAAAVAAGIAGILGGLLLVLETVSPGSISGTLVLTSSLFVILGGALFAAGLFGLYALLRRQRSKLALLGVILTGLSAVALVTFAATMLVLRNFPVGYPSYEVSSIPPLLTLANFWSFNTGYLAGVVGLLLLGVATLRTRTLGRWSFLPAALFLLCTPAPFLVSLFLYSGGTMEVDANLSSGLALGLLPTALPGIAAILLGYPLLRGAETATVGS